MELIIPQKSINFDFHSARTSPHVSPPTTPRRFRESYFSAPTSPSRVAELYDEISKMGMCEEITEEFDFQFCSDMKAFDTLSSADELFDGGKIKPMKSPPKLEIVFGDFSASGITNDLSRGRAMDSPMSHSSRRVTRSLSPLRIGAILGKQGDQQRNDIAKTASSSSSSSSSSVFRKWKLKDFMLFRSASEGRASGKYPLKKFTEDLKSKSFRSVNSFGSDPGMRKKTQMSAHEVLYTKNKAASDSLKKKTYLPYKQGIFARLF